MRYQSVHLASLAHAVPEEVVTSEALEGRLASLYDRLGVSIGRLELMSGIRARRFWPPGTRPSHAAALAGELALLRANVPAAELGLLIFAGVCRDFMEPATASVVHGRLGLPTTCQAFDLSNACLGFANALTVAAELVERGSIGAALVVSGEDARPLVDETVRALTRGEGVTRRDLKRAQASLTIGSGGAAAVVAHTRLAPDAPRLVGGVALAATEHVELCSGDRTAGGGGPLMETDSEALLHAGNALAARTWPAFLEELAWRADEVDRIVTHQVGVQHKKLLFETLGLDHTRDFPTVAEFGNVGSVSLPLSLSLACDAGFVRAGHRVALLGIGSGLHCAMLGLEYAP
jgi:3-oxoacyl-[acyl-carrier-protein] synthase III